MKTIVLMFVVMFSMALLVYYALSFVDFIVTAIRDSLKRAVEHEKELQILATHINSRCVMYFVVEESEFKHPKDMTEIEYLKCVDKIHNLGAAPCL